MIHVIPVVYGESLPRSLGAKSRGVGWGFFSEWVGSVFWLRLLQTEGMGLVSGEEGLEELLGPNTHPHPHPTTYHQLTPPRPSQKWTSPEQCRFPKGKK